MYGTSDPDKASSPGPSQGCIADEISGEGTEADSCKFKCETGNVKDDGKKNRVPFTNEAFTDEETMTPRNRTSKFSNVVDLQKTGSHPSRGSSASSSSGTSFKWEEQRYKKFPLLTAFIRSLGDGLYYRTVFLVFGLALPISEVLSDKLRPWQYAKGYMFFTLSISIISLLLLYIFRLGEKITNAKERRKKRVRRKSSAMNLLPQDIDIHVVPIPKPNLFLRVAALIFGLASITKDASDVAWSHSVGSNEVQAKRCRADVWQIISSSLLIMKVLQLFLIVFPFQLYTRSLRFIAKVLTQHVFATNICQAVWISIRIIFAEMSHTYGTQGHQDNVANKACRSNDYGWQAMLNCSIGSPAGAFSIKAIPYLYPCDIHFLFISAVSTYVVWKQHGRRSKVGFFRNVEIQKKKIRSVCTKSFTESMTARLFSQSLYGTMSGFALTVATIFCIAAYHFWSDVSYMLEVNYAVEISIYVTSTLVCLICLRRMKEMPQRVTDTGDTMEVFLPLAMLWISCAVSTANHTLSLMACVFSKHERNKIDLVTNLASLVHSTLQTLFLVFTVRKQVINEKQCKEKPGRQFVVFLVYCNLSLWALNFFRYQHTEDSPVQMDFYGFSTWLVVSTICQPATVFYYWLSTVLSLRIWWKSYTIELKPTPMFLTS